MTTTALSGRICECGLHFPMGSGICACGRLYISRTPARPARIEGPRPECVACGEEGTHLIDGAPFYPDHVAGVAAVPRPANCVCQWKGPGHFVTDPGCPAFHDQRQPREHPVPCRHCGTPTWAVSASCDACEAGS